MDAEQFSNLITHINQVQFLLAALIVVLMTK